MNANVVLRAPLNYAQPHFRPGQVLPDTELTWLANFSCSRLEAESRRQGWGVVWGLVARASAPGTIDMSPGVATDQKGRMFTLAETSRVDLSKLIDKTAQQDLQRGGGKAQRFILWLEIGNELIGQPLAGQTLGVGGAQVPDVQASVRGQPPRDAVVGNLTLLPGTQHDDLLKKRKERFDDFANAFNDPAISDDIEFVGQKRLEVLAQWIDKPPVEYRGVPLGIVEVDSSNDGQTITSIERIQELYTDTRDRLPTIQDHINVAPVLGLSVDQATAWLEARGVRVWAVREFPRDQRIYFPTGTSSTGRRGRARAASCVGRLR